LIIAGGHSLVAYMKSTLILCILLAQSLSILAAEEFPEIKTLDGKTYRQAKVTKATAVEIKVIHADGFATIPLSQLPPDIRARFGEANPDAEAAAEMERKLNNRSAALLKKQEIEALRVSEIIKQPIELCRQAIALRDWCLANPAGGTFGDQTLDQKARDARLAEATEILAKRPDAPPPAAIANPAQPPAAVTSTMATTEVAPATSFQPGVIELVSARYTLLGNQPRNVKNRLQKLIPTGAINAPVSILVSDELSDAAKAQGTVTTGVGVGVSTTDANGTTIGVGAAQFQTTPNNILTVEYVFNGQRFKKQAAEGTQLILP
jgi:hypothetical protein